MLDDVHKAAPLSHLLILNYDFFQILILDVVLQEDECPARGRSGPCFVLHVKCLPHSLKELGSCVIIEVADAVSKNDAVEFCRTWIEFLHGDVMDAYDLLAELLAELIGLFDRLLSMVHKLYLLEMLQQQAFGNMAAAARDLKSPVPSHLWQRRHHLL